MQRFSTLRNALVVAFVSGACGDAAPVGPAVSPPARTERLWTPPGAALEGPHDEPTPAGVQGVSFRISVPQAEELTTQLRDYVERGDWHARYSSPFVAASFRNGWTKAGMGVRVPPQAGVPRIVDVREWAGDWDNQGGDRLEYRLMAVRREGSTLTDVSALGRYGPAVAVRR